MGSEKALICCGVAAKPARPPESSAPGWEQENPAFSHLFTSPGVNPTDSPPDRPNYGSSVQ